MKKYKSKLLVEAIQFDGTNFNECHKFLKDRCAGKAFPSQEGTTLEIQSVGIIKGVSVGEWIVFEGHVAVYAAVEKCVHVNGGYNLEVYNQEDFEKAYELVKEPEEQTKEWTITIRNNKSKTEHSFSRAFLEFNNDTLETNVLNFKAYDTSFNVWASRLQFTLLDVKEALVKWARRNK